MAVDNAPATATAQAQGEFLLTRIFDAPREVVFKAWTESERLMQWFGPKGFAIHVRTNDLRPGGIVHYSMTSSDGSIMWGRWAYREIVEPERLVFVASFADPEGNIIRAPFSDTWPLEVLSTVILADHEGKTKLTLRGIAINATDAERAGFEAGHGSMQKGWTGTLDQLDEYLTTNI